uniref:Sulfate transport system permease protein CysT n=1 Tax=Derbesia sp. WEST4838 TaxID=1847751 RepID=A0A1C9JBB6_9CHLO|nr:sulfate ABC transporter permease subunit CysT [Derbesia sp. WEST4838]AOP19149.1 sulfate ABC transporter permease subunit CysT [Derbesia sp. WEST4838]
MSLKLIFICFYCSCILFLPISLLLKEASHYLWLNFWDRATEPVALSAYSVTLSMACIACFINTIFGFIIAWSLARYKFKLSRFIDAIIDLPFALPTSVAGFTLCIVYSESGPFRVILENLNIQIVYTKLGILLAMLFVSLPFIIRSVQPIITLIDKEIEEAAWSLGASPWITFSKIIFPNLISALSTGVTLAFSRAIGEYGSIVIISSNFAMKDLIVPVLIFQYLEQYDYIGATVIGSVILFISLSLLFFINWIQKRPFFNF